LSANATTLLLLDANVLIVAREEGWVCVTSGS
jgi:hypothetical protein